jgi:dipeptidyl aminopeptidase/acylaminoacyl peptidase
MSGRIIRQGDVLLQPIAQLGTEFKAAPLDRDGSATLARGEATGHRHRLEFQAGPDGAALATVYVHPSAPEEVARIRLDARQDLVHEEHSTHGLEAGTYRVSRPFEYTGTALVRIED